MHRAYVTAVIDLITTTNDVEGVLRGLKAALDARGHGALLLPILRAVERELEAARESIVVTVAKESDAVRLKGEIEAMLQTLGATSAPSIVVDETIIGGAIVEADHVRIDQSYKNALTTLYRSLTT